MELMCRRKAWSNGVEIVVFDDRQTGPLMYAERLTMREIERGMEVTEPTMSLTNDQAQGLMDELWRCGLRPTEGSGSAGSLAATERHLNDMRAIALGLLAKNGVPGIGAP